MEQIKEILFALTREGLGSKCDSSKCRFNDRLDWNEVIKLAAVQGVLAIAWDGLLRQIEEVVIPTEYLPSKEIKLRWLANIDKIEQSYNRQLKTIEKLATFYSQNGFEMMLLKGYGLSLCYPTPEHRSCGDIDIWLYGRQQEADELLRKTHGVKINEDKHHHTTFTVNGILVENHCNFLNIHSHASNVALEKILRELSIQPHSEQINLNKATIALPSPNFNALFLLKHMSDHFATSETVLRHLCDWAIFARKYGKQVDWAHINEIAKRFNLDRFLAISNRICVENLGSDIADFGNISSDDSYLTERVINEIITPEFNKTQPYGDIVKVILFRARRWWAKRWKQRLVYKESLIAIFFRRIYGYILNPMSIKK